MTRTEHRRLILEEIRAERARQVEKWGERDHDPFTLCTILAEETGEVARAAHDARYADGTLDQLRKEAIQVAAVALQFVETLDKGAWTWGCKT